MALTDIDAQRLGDSVADKLGVRNLIINGAMNVAQRGTSSTTNGYGSVDRFFVQWDGGTTTHTQTAITSGSPYDEGFRNVLRLTNTATATGAGNYRNPFQYIEAQNIAQSGWDYTSSSSYVTLSFWVRSSVAQEFYGYLRTFDGTGQHYSFSLGSLSANTWTKVTKVIPGNSNITVNNDSGAGLQVNISPFWGTDFTDSGHTTGAWAAFNSGSRAPDYTNTWANTTNATFDITGVQLEVGNTATPFEHRSFADELARCQRYYYEVTSSTANKNMNQQGVLLAASATAYEYLPIPPVPMRAAPSCTLTDDVASMRLDGGSSVIDVNLNGTDLLALPNGNGFSGHIFGSRKSGTGFTIGNTGRLCTGSTAGKLAFSAEL
jgi:hypothetical protein